MRGHCCAVVWAKIGDPARQTLAIKKWANISILRPPVGNVVYIQDSSRHLHTGHRVWCVRRRRRRRRLTRQKSKSLFLSFPLGLLKVVPFDLLLRSSDTLLYWLTVFGLFASGRSAAGFCSATSTPSSTSTSSAAFRRAISSSKCY